MADLITTFYMKRGDRLPELKGAFLDETTLLPIDLTGTTLKFHLRDPVDPDVVLVNANAVIDGDPTLGRFRYAWGVTDTDLPAGRYPFEIEATFSGNRQLTSPNKRNGTLVITDDIA